MITGIKQSIFDQTGAFGFQFGLIISDLTKQVNVGFTGNTNVNWNFYQGKIYDNKNYYCGSYLANQNVLISGEIGNKTLDYYINQEITCVGQSKNTGIINYFYVNTETGNSVNFNTNIFGNIPNYTLINNINFNVGSSGTGAFLSHESLSTFRIFSGVGDNSNITYLGNTTGNITPGNSGLYYIYISGAQPNQIYSGNYTFYTNFGDVNAILAFNALPTGSNSQTQFNLNLNNFNGISGTPHFISYDLGSLGFLTTATGLQINTPFLDVRLLYNTGYTGTFSGYQKTFTGAWNLKTGVNQNNLLDFKQNNYYNYTGFFNTGGSLTNLTGTSMSIRVDYTPYSDYNIDTAKLLITGINSGIEIIITGRRI